MPDMPDLFLLLLIRKLQILLNLMIGFKVTAMWLVEGCFLPSGVVALGRVCYQTTSLSGSFF